MYQRFENDGWHSIGLLASGLTAEEILKMYPYLQHEDLMEALSYAAWRSEEIEVPLAAS